MEAKILRKNAKRMTYHDKIFDYAIKFIFALIIIGILYPLWFIIIASLSDPAAVSNGEVLIIPKKISLEGYKALFSAGLIWKSYLNTIIYTFVGTLVQLAINLPAGYAISRKELYGKKWILLFFAIPMFIGGGLIPSYLNIKSLGLLDNPLVLIIPGAVSTYNILVIQSFFKENIPETLWEAAQMDGCSTMRYFLKVVIPLSKAIIAVIGLWVAVGIWNNWFDAMIYIKNENLHPLQLILRRLLIVNEGIGSGGASTTSELQRQRSEMMKYGAMIVSTVPIMCVYPFLQKYFNQGVMVGSVKE